MRIFGFKLPSKKRYVHEEDSTESLDEEYEIINPEKQYSSACHLYESADGKQYVGFELSLRIDEDEMFLLLGNKGKTIRI